MDVMLNGVKIGHWDEAGRYHPYPFSLPYARAALRKMVTLHGVEWTAATAPVPGERRRNLDGELVTYFDPIPNDAFFVPRPTDDMDRAQYNYQQRRIDAYASSRITLE